MDYKTPTRIRYEEAFEKELKEALYNRDASVYYRLCNELGRMPKDRDDFLYGRGEVEVMTEKRLDELRAERARNQKYLDFLTEAENFAIPRDLGAWSDKKKALLRKYFAGRFGENGSQDLEKRSYDAFQIGKIYLALIEEAKKKEKSVREMEESR